MYSKISDNLTSRINQDKHPSSFSVRKYQTLPTTTTKKKENNKWKHIGVYLNEEAEVNLRP